jgi:tartrate dehydratase alpha subunit/fumarate hydratase class I-like protein
MVSLPLVAFYGIATNVTSAARLGKNHITVGSGKRSSIPPCDLALTSRLPKFRQSLHKVGIGLKGIGCAGFFHGTPIQVAGKNGSVIIVLLIVGRVCDQIISALRA